MTVANVPRRQAYMANGVTTSFPVPFTFFEIAVYVDGVLKNYGPDYTITQASTGTNGTVTFGTPPLGGTSVVVVGDTAIKQETDYVDNGPFPAASHELALDRLTMAVQELRRSLGLTIRAPEYADTTPAAAIPDTNGIPLVSYERGIAPLDVGEGWLFTDANSVVHTRVALPGTAAQLIRAPVVGADVNKGVVVGTGATLTDTGLATLGDVAARRRVAPHARVHGRRNQHRLVGGEQRGGGQIVGVTAGHARHEIGGGGRDDQQIGLARKADVADLAFAVEVEQVGQHEIVRQRADRQRRHELLRRLGHDGAHAEPALAQAADQIQAFVGGDAAADDE